MANGKSCLNGCSLGDGSLARRRRSLICAAATASALMMAAAPAKAHVSYCDLSPDNCFFGGDGRRYYFPPGSPAAAAVAAGKYSVPQFVEATRLRRLGTVDRPVPHGHHRHAR